MHSTFCGLQQQKQAGGRCNRLHNRFLVMQLSMCAPLTCRLHQLLAHLRCSCPYARRSAHLEASSSSGIL